MTELNRESGSPEGAIDANQSASSGASANTSVDVEALAKALEPRLEALVNKRFQSAKDTRIDKLVNLGDKFESQLARLKELQGEGFTEKAALRLMKLESEPQEPPEQFSDTATPQGKAGNQPQASSGGYAELLTALGLTANDAEVVAALDPNDFVATVARLTSISNKRKQPAPAAPNPASVMPTTSGSSVPSADDRESLTAELMRLQQNPSANHDKMMEISAKLKQLLPKQ